MSAEDYRTNEEALPPPMFAPQLTRGREQIGLYSRLKLD